MSYESNLDRQSSKLINPAQLCLLLSIALHLLVLKFGLPTIKFNRDGGQREVSIIELNPEQQARLPDLYPQLETPDVPSDLPQPDLNEPAAPFAIPPNLLPELSDPANLPPLIIPPPPTFNIPPLPPITDITLPPIGDLSELPLPPTINPEDFNIEPIELPPNLGKVPEVPTESSEVKTPSKTPNVVTKPESALENPTEQPKIEPKETVEQFKARKVAESQERIKKLRQSLSENEGTTDEEARKNYIAWLTKVRDIEPDRLEITGAYPRDACIRRLKGSSVFGVVVNAKGEVVALDLIKGSKYPIFDREANKELGDRAFDNDTEKPKPYQVKVNYEYDAEICPSLTLPSIKRAEEKQQVPEPEPESVPTPAPEPEEKPASEPEPKPEEKPEPASEPEPQPEEKPEPVSKPEPQPEEKPLRDRLRDVPLPDLDPSKLKDIPLPDRPNFERSQ